MSVIDEILQWTKSRPAWQQDAVRRLFERDQLGDNDYDELIDICKASMGIIVEGSVEAVPPEDAPNTSGSRPQTVTLTNISQLQSINSLANGSELSFSDDGLTIIYGPNGAGKSGYFRILQMLCRARKKPSTILPNVFDSTSANPSARVNYTVDGQAKASDWQSSSESPVELSFVSVFDRSCASVYIESDQEVAYMPLGLDLFDKLAQACNVIKKKLEIEKGQLESVLEVPDFVKDTSINALITDLVDEETIHAIHEYPDFSDGDQKRHDELIALISTARSANPQKKLIELRSIKARISELRRNVKQIELKLSQAELDSLLKRRQSAQILRDTVKLAAERLFDAQPLKGVGTDTWETLWESARSYSESHAYPENDFPMVCGGARCPLCQQELSGEASTRLMSFEEHIKGDVTAKAEKAEMDYKDQFSVYTQLSVPTELDEDITSELESHTDRLSVNLLTFFENAGQIKQAVIEQKEKLTGLNLENVMISSQIDALIERIATNIERLTQLSSTPESTSPLEAELSELKAKKWLTENKTSVEAEIDIQKQIAAIETAISRQTNTTGITTKSNELTEQFVSTALKQSFTQELEQISANGLAVKLERKRGQKGIVYHEIQLVNAQQGADISSIMSEGENQAIALAVFFAESSQNQVTAPLVFDDPITSLDHLRREYIAERIVEEARRTQVIVFTHDLPFMLDLREMANTRSIPANTTYLRRNNGKSLPPSEDPSWEDMPINKKLRFLTNRVQEARIAQRSRSQAEYDSFIRESYAYLREAWECSIEEVLFNQSIKRLSRPVQTQRLRALIEFQFTQADYDAITSGMSEASTRFRGHSRPAAANSTTPPTPIMFENSVTNLSDWIAQLRTRMGI